VTPGEIQDVVMQALIRIAPEAAAQPLDPAVNLRDQIDLDSMDMLNLVIGLHERLGVDIPEADYARLTTLEALTAYLSDRLSRAAPGGIP
jgi:acyl carrier protein